MFCAKSSPNRTCCNPQLHASHMGGMIVGPTGPHSRSTPPSRSPRQVRPDDRARCAIRSPIGSHSPRHPNTLSSFKHTLSLIRGLDGGRTGPTSIGSAIYRIARGSITRSTILIKHQWGPPGPTIQTSGRSLFSLGCTVPMDMSCIQLHQPPKYYPITVLKMQNRISQYHKTTLSHEKGIKGFYMH